MRVPKRSSSGGLGSGVASNVGTEVSLPAESTMKSDMNISSVVPPFPSALFAGMFLILDLNLERNRCLHSAHRYPMEVANTRYNGGHPDQRALQGTQTHSLKMELSVSHDVLHPALGVLCLSLYELWHSRKESPLLHFHLGFPGLTVPTLLLLRQISGRVVRK